MTPSWSDRATRLLQAFPRQRTDRDGYGFVRPENMPTRFKRSGLPVYDAVIDFQRTLAGHVFYDGPRSAPYTPYLWGIQSPVPDNAPGEPYEDECVVLTDAHPFGFWIREDGRIEVDGQVHASSAAVLVENQALEFEWDTVIRPAHTTYFVRLDVLPRDDEAYWHAVMGAVEGLGLSRVAEASDSVRQWFASSTTRLLLEPYYGMRSFSNDVPARWGRLHSTSAMEAEAFHERLRVGAGWGPLTWRGVTAEHFRRPADFWWLPDF